MKPTYSVKYGKCCHAVEASTCHLCNPVEFVMPQFPDFSTVISRKLNEIYGIPYLVDEPPKGESQ